MKDLSFLGVDISKDSITVYDGKKLHTFPNERYLKKFKEKMFKRLSKEKTVIIYEPTGPYSSFLEEFVAIEKIKVVAINPRKTLYLLRGVKNRGAFFLTYVWFCSKLHVMIKFSFVSLMIECNQWWWGS